MQKFKHYKSIMLLALNSILQVPDVANFRLNQQNYLIQFHDIRPSIHLKQASLRVL